MHSLLPSFGVEELLAMATESVTVVVCPQAFISHTPDGYFSSVGRNAFHTFLAHSKGTAWSSSGRKLFSLPKTSDAEGKASLLGAARAFHRDV